jgi:hypothetical protein
MTPLQAGMAPVEFVLVAPDTSIKIKKNEKIEIAVAISHLDRVFIRFSCFNDPGLRQVESQVST